MNRSIKSSAGPENFSKSSVGRALSRHTIGFNTTAYLSIALVILLAISTIHIFTQIIRFTYGNDNLLGLTPLFYMYAEQNVPTWFSSVLLLSCAGLLAMVANAKMRLGDKFRFHWWILCFLFIFLSLDETAMIHEKVGELFGRIFLHSVPSSWLIPYLLFAGLAAFSFVPFLLSLPKRYQILFCISGAVYVGGAAGLEAIEVFHVLGGGANDPIFVFLVTIEEMMEQAGAILFSFSLLSYIKNHIGEICIRVL